MIFYITVLCLLVTQATLTPHGDYSSVLKYDQLYYSIAVSQYTTAINTTTELQDEGNGDVIRSVVNRLLSEGKRNVVHYGMKLVTVGRVSVVNEYFPKELKWILTGEEVTFINRRDRMALKLERYTDHDGDRGAYGDSDEWDDKRMAWKVIPQWYKDEKVYFEILNMNFNQYLKLEKLSGRDGDHKAFGGTEHNTWRHLWSFHPVVVGNETLVYIINREFNQPLKLERYIDGDGDRRVWGHNGSPIGNPEQFAWHVKLHRDFE